MEHTLSSRNLGDQPLHFFWEVNLIDDLFLDIVFLAW